MISMMRKGQAPEMILLWPCCDSGFLIRCSATRGLSWHCQPQCGTTSTFASVTALNLAS